MKNILVYITILIMMMPGVKLSADITLRTNDPFAMKAPAENNPFAGGTPKDIERNLFAPKNIRVHHKYKFDPNKQGRKTSYINGDVVVNGGGSNSLAGGNNATSYRRYNMPYNGNNITTVTYSMPVTMKTSVTEAFSEEGTNTTPPSINNNYEGAGAPSEYAPVGDAVLPLLLLAMMYVVVMRRKRESMS